MDILNGIKELKLKEKLSKIEIEGYLNYRKAKLQIIGLKNWNKKSFFFLLCTHLSQLADKADLYFLQMCEMSNPDSENFIILAIVIESIQRKNIWDDFPDSFSKFNFHRKIWFDSVFAISRNFWK